MKTIVLLAAMFAATLVADDRPRGHGRWSENSWGRGNANQYAWGSRNLPPGLAKRGGNLPPGLQRQLDRRGHLPPGLEKRRPSGYYGRYDGFGYERQRPLYGRDVFVDQDDNGLDDRDERRALYRQRQRESATWQDLYRSRHDDYLSSRHLYRKNKRR